MGEREKILERDKFWREKRFGEIKAFWGENRFGQGIFLEREKFWREKFWREKFGGEKNIYCDYKTVLIFRGPSN